ARPSLSMPTLRPPNSSSGAGTKFPSGGVVWRPAQSLLPALPAKEKSVDADRQRHLGHARLQRSPAKPLSRFDPPNQQRRRGAHAGGGTRAGGVADRSGPGFIHSQPRARRTGQGGNRGLRLLDRPPLHRGGRSELRQPPLQLMDGYSTQADQVVNEVAISIAN